MPRYILPLCTTLLLLIAGLTLAFAADPPPAQPVAEIRAVAAKITLSVAVISDGKVVSIQPVEVQVFESQFDLTLQAISVEAIRQAKEKK